MILEALQENNISLPPKLELLSVAEIDKECITWTEWNKLSEDEQYENTKGVICDNPNWVGRLLDGEQYLSSDEFGDRVYMSVKFGKVLLHKKIEESGLRVVKSITLKNKKINILGGTKMANVNGQDLDLNINMGDLGDLNDLDSAILGSTPAGVENMTAFNEEAAPKTAEDEAKAAKRKKTMEEKKRRSAELEHMLSDVSKNSSDTSNALKSFCFNNGELVCHITRTNEGIKVSTAEEFQKDGEGKMQLDLSKATEADVRKFTQEGKVPRALALKTKAIAFKQAAPGKHLAMVIAMPKDACVDFDQARTSELKLQDTTRVVKAYSKEVGIAVITSYFGGHIREAEATHPNIDEKQTELRVVAEPDYNAKKRKIEKMRKDGKEVNPDDIAVDMRVKLVFDKSSGRKKLITPENYIPTRVYKTRELNASISEAEAAEINKDLFGSFFTKNTKGERRIDKLAGTESAKMISYDEKTGTITSDYVKAGNKGLGVKVVSYATGEVITNPRIPVKELVKSETSDSIRYSYVYFDLLKDDDANNVDEFSKWSPTVLPEFKTAVDLAGDAVDRENLIKLVKSTKKKGGAKSEVTGSELSRIATAVFQEDAIGNFSIEAFKNINSRTISAAVAGIE